MNLMIIFIGKKEIDLSLDKIWESDEEFKNRRKNDGKKKYRNARRLKNKAASHSRARNR